MNDLTKEELDIILAALERYYYLCRSDSDFFERLDEINKLERKINDMNRGKDGSN